MCMTDSLTTLSWYILSSPFPSLMVNTPIKYFSFDLRTYISLAYITHGPVSEQLIQTQDMWVQLVLCVKLHQKMEDRYRIQLHSG